MLGHGLAGHRQVLAEAGRGAHAVDEQLVEHPAPHRVTDSRPQVVVDHDAHAPAPTFSAYTGSRGRKKSQPVTCSAYSWAAFASSQPRSRKPLSVIRSRVPSPAG